MFFFKERTGAKYPPPLRWGWVLFERAQILSRIQFTMDFIEMPRQDHVYKTADSLQRISKRFVFDEIGDSSPLL